MKWLRRFIKPIDPRLKAELKAQRRSIALGLMCVVVTSLLSSGTIPLIRASVDAVAYAAPGDQPPPSLRKPLERTGGGAQTPGAAGEAVAKPKTEERRRKALENLGWVCLAIVGLFAAKYWFTRGQSYFLSRAGAEMGASLRLQLFQKLQKLPITYFNQKRTGAIQSVLSSDVNVYQSAIAIMKDSIDAPVKALSAFAWIAFMQPQFAIIALISVPMFAWVIQRNGRRMRQAQRKVQEDLSTLNALTQEALAGTRVVKAFGAEASLLESYRRLLRATLTSQLRAIRRLAALRPLVELLGAGVLASALYLCGWLAFSGRLVVGEIAALIFAMDLINQGFRTWGSMNNTYNQVQAAAQRLYAEVLDVPEEHAAASGSKVLERTSGRIEFRNVGFSYPDGTRALSGVSFVIEPGTSLALVGPSGAGKSTIADLLLRFYDPDEGQVLIDGVDLRELNTAWFRSQVGVVPQQTFLFAGTIAENLRLAKSQATDEELREAARVAHADGFIDAMPEGFETRLGERGVRLSGGEMQRIAIARAILRKPPILILDEATSNLDPVSEKAVQEALEEVMKDRSTLFIAHRLTTAARADRILVLRRGEVIESGSHRELLDQGGAYAGMYRAYNSGVLLDESLA